MKNRAGRRLLRPLFWMFLLLPAATDAAAAQERFTTTPVIAEGLLLIASSDWNGHQGHLRALDLHNPLAGALWDAADRVPLPGTGSRPGGLPDSDPPERPAAENLYRSVYTNLPGQSGVQSLRPFTAPAAEVLQDRLMAGDAETAQALINRARGRVGCTPESPAGSGVAPVPLWGLGRAAPVLVGRSPVLAGPEVRDRVVYVGSAGGLLHAIHAGSWDAAADRYRQDDPAAGTELWAYLPGSLLPALRDQPYDSPDLPPVLHLDGTPAVGDFFLAPEGDFRRRWRTLLAATATILPRRQSCLFVLDVTDPYQPQLLWEQLLPGANTGPTRGVAFGRAGEAGRPVLFLSTALAVGIDSTGEPDPLHGRHGLQLLALDLLDGTPLWAFRRAYDEAAGGVVAPPPVVTPVDADGDGRTDWVVCGDLAGRLWVLDAAAGAPLGAGPVFTTPGGAAEPIGAPATIRGATVYFGTGGADHADPNGQYALYAVQLGPDSGRLLWRLALEPGEQVWQAPLVDGSGNLLVGTAYGYRETDAEPGRATRGRLLLLAGDGSVALSNALSAAAVARPVVSAGRLVTVSVTGAVSQFGGSEGILVAEESSPGPLRIWSWRLR